MYKDYKDQALLGRALEALNKTGLIAHVMDGEVNNQWQGRGDFHVQIQYEEHTYTYVAEIKRIDRFAMLGQIKNEIGPDTERTLIVAPRITAETAEKCRELNLQFIDANGNAYLKRPGLLVFVKGQKPAKGETTYDQEAQDRPRAGTATHLRVIFVLLCRPELLNAPYREITQAAGVALGTIGWVFTDLKTRGFTTGGKHKDDRLLLERQRLLQEWVTNFPIKLRPKLHRRKFRAAKLDWWRDVEITQYHAQWGGEVAAEKLTGYLKAETTTVYLHEGNGTNNLNKLVVDHRLRADPQGNIEILEAFWDWDGEIMHQATVPPLLVYADLLATLDPRNLDTARLIYDQFLKNADTKF